SELEAARKQLHRERLRLKRLRRRLKQRLHRRVVAERHLVRQREAEVATARQRLEQERQSLRQEREVVTQVRLRASGDVEFGKRQLQEEWDALRKAQQQWQCQREEQEAELTQRGRALRRGEEALADAERALGDDRYAWEARRRHREQERDGLEARIVNQRRKLAEQQAALQQLEAQRPAPEPPVSGAKLPVGEILEGVPAHEAHLREIEAHINRRAAALERVAGDLDDQRLELVEHWQRAAQVQDDWQRTHAAVVEHLESLTAAFPQREQALLTRQRALDGA